MRRISLGAALLFFGFYPKALSQPVDQALAPATALFSPAHNHR